MDNCPQCGVDRDRWGRLHNCNPRTRSVASEASNLKQQVSPVEISPGSSTYKYRDPAKRKPQVAAAMRAYRLRKKAK